jgi:hypothetical protein
MSQRQQDRAVLDIIENLLKPEQPEMLVNEDGSDWMTKWWASTLFMLIVIAGIALLSWEVTVQEFRGVNEDWQDLVLPIIIITLGLILVHQGVQRGSSLAKRRVDHANFLYSQIAIRNQQRSELLQHLTSADVARAMANSQYSAADLEYSLRHREMDNANQEAEKDRDLTRDTLDMQIMGDLRKLERELQSTHPSAQQRSQDATILLRSRIDQLKTIKEITDKKVRKQAYDQFIRGQN